VSVGRKVMRETRLAVWCAGEDGELLLSLGVGEGDGEIEGGASGEACAGCDAVIAAVVIVCSGYGAMEMGTVKLRSVQALFYFVVPLGE
jgi:hypothetical protein